MSDPTAKARREAEEIYVALSFELEQNRRTVAAAMERELTLRSLRRRIVRVYQMAGGDPADLGEDAVITAVAA